MRELIRILNLPRCINTIAITSDGHYLGQRDGDMGFNAFFGKPSPPHSGPGHDASVATWKGYTGYQRRMAVKAARAIGCDLRAFLPR